MEPDPPISHVISDGWINFAEMVLPTVGGAKNAQAHNAFYFGVMFAFQIVEEVLAQKSGEAVSLALNRLNSELDEFMKSHEIQVQ